MRGSGGLKCPGGGKNITSIFNAFERLLTCIFLRVNLSNCF